MNNAANREPITNNPTTKVAHPDVFGPECVEPGVGTWVGVGTGDETVFGILIDRKTSTVCTLPSTVTKILSSLAPEGMPAVLADIMTLMGKVLFSSGSIIKSPQAGFALSQSMLTPAAGPPSFLIVKVEDLFSPSFNVPNEIVFGEIEIFGSSIFVSMVSLSYCLRLAESERTAKASFRSLQNSSASLIFSSRSFKRVLSSSCPYLAFRPLYLSG